MFTRLFAVASLVSLAVAGLAPLAVRDQCTTGAINCCNNVAQSSNDLANVFGKDIVSALVGVTGQIAWNCGPISIVGVLNSGAQCTQQAVCCEGNKYNGVIQTGCSPISL